MIQLKQSFVNTCRKAAARLPVLQVQVSSPLLDEDFIYSSTVEGQSFHSASVGKLMTAVAVVRLIERGRIGWDTKIATMFGAERLAGLFVVGGIDHAKDVTVEELLGHTSGVNDYFEGITGAKESFLDQVIREPDRFYRPDDLLDYTRKNQTAVGKPGERFLYSDTGYVVLGLLCEKVYEKPFDRILNDELFDPLGMTSTGLLFYDPKVDQGKLAPVILKQRDLSQARSLSADFSGGGLATTASDLTIFLKAFRDGKLVSAASFARMSKATHPFQAGMFYGLGMMELRFEKFFFLLKGFPRLYGHLGVLGVHAWFDPLTGDSFVINVGDMGKMVPSFKLLIQLSAALRQARISAAAPRR